MYKEVYYVIGLADESDEYYLETISDDKFDTKEKAEQEITKRLEDWGYAEGCKRSDYDITKVTMIIERGIK